ncbi:MAG: hypothetical protein MZU79_01730, partial [Anaerotruncus sp.]|nr:hypothetical protein [Anaerotruncus sp.]
LRIAKVNLQLGAHSAAPAKKGQVLIGRSPDLLGSKKPAEPFPRSFGILRPAGVIDLFPQPGYLS